MTTVDIDRDVLDCTDGTCADEDRGGAHGRAGISDLDLFPCLLVGVGIEGSFVIHKGHGDPQKCARLAASCLLQPQVGDVVLVTTLSKRAESVCWILAVLRRAETDAEAILAVPRAVALSISSPTLTLRAEKSLSIHSGKLQIESGPVEFCSSVVRMTASVVYGVAHRLTLAAERIEVLAKHLLASTQTRIVRVEEADTLHAGHRAATVTGMDVVDAGDVVVNARDTVRVDGETILMG